MAKLRFPLIALVFLAFLVTGKASAQNCDSICTDGDTCIAAALYPYVPDTNTFAQSICTAWEESGRTETLYLIADESVWDGGYGSNPVYTNGNGAQTPIDVFVYDAMYLSYWAQQTTPVPASFISNPADFVSYARTALTQPDDSMLALPMLGCTNIMFYNEDDAGIDSVSTLPEFIEINPAGVYISPVPYNRSGAMVNMAGKTTIAVNYMVRGFLETGEWPSMASVDPAIITPLTELAESASYYNAITGAIPSLAGVEDQYVRAGYFSEGYGRTSVGFSESMSQMSAATRSELKLRALPRSDNAAAPNMFYADVVGVNDASQFLSDGGTLPFILANLMTEQAVMQNAIAPPSGSLSYLFPARSSILTALGAQDPLYTQMEAVLTGKPALLVNMPTTSRVDFHGFGAQVQTAVISAFSGQCDMESATYIGSTEQASSICPQVCEKNSGWIGSWTNMSPPAWPGYSACGCAQCSASSPLPASDTAGMEMAVPEPSDLRYNRN